MKSGLLLLMALGGCVTAGYGEHCDDGEGDNEYIPCEGELVCSSFDTCSCPALDPVLAEGADCTVTAACDGCREGLGCNWAGGACTELASIPEGGACGNNSPSAADALCVEGLVCNSNEAVRRCIVPGTVVEGELCSADNQCAATLFCDTSVFDDGDMRCRVPSQDGEQCNSSLSCEDTSTCWENVCGPRHGPGEPCFDDQHCAEGLSCVYDAELLVSLCRAS